MALDGDHRLIVLPPEDLRETAFSLAVKRLRHRFGGALFLAAHHHLRGDDAERLRRLSAFAADHAVPLAAANDVRMHVAARPPFCSTW